MRRYVGPVVFTGIAALLAFLIWQLGDSPEDQSFHEEALRPIVDVEDEVSEPTELPPIEMPNVIPPGWERLPDPPNRNSGNRAIASVGEDLLVFGGTVAAPEGCNPLRNECEPELLLSGSALSDSTGTWRPVASLPMPIAGGEMHMHKGALYARSACAGNEDCSTEAMLRYRAADDEWDVLPPIPGVTGQLVTVGDDLYAIKGGVQSFADAVWEEGSGSWSGLPPLPGAVDLRNRFGVNIDGDLVVIGTPITPDEALPAIAFRLRPESGDWVLFEIPRMSVCAVLLLGEDIFLISPKRRFAVGLRGARFVAFDGRWEPLPPGPAGEPLWDCGLGGIVGPNQVALSQLDGWFIDTETNRWTRNRHPLDESGFDSFGTATTHGRSVVITGGLIGPSDTRPDTILLGTWKWTPS